MEKLTESRVNNIFSGMQEACIAVIGDLMLDRYIWGETERISPEAPVPIVRLLGESANMGGAANVAANVSTLGAEVQLFGIIGEDAEGEKLRELIERSKFGLSGVISTSSRPTVAKTRVIAGSQHIVRIDRETTDELEENIRRELIGRFKQALKDVKAVILEDYNKGVLTREFIREIIDTCRSADIPVGVDPKRENFWDYRGANVFKPNLRELENALGRALIDEDELIKAGREVQERLEVDHLLVTRGREGMALFSDGDVRMIPTQAQRVHDVSGAGDTVIATIMTSLAGGADIYEAAYLANCAASIVIAEVGAVPVDLQKLKRTCLRD